MLTNVAITKLHPHPDNPRKDLGDLKELADSIKARGILQNLTVVPIDAATDDTDYTVVIGHRRLAAAELAGLTELPCAISDMDYKLQIATILLENIQRNDLTVYEQAQGFQMMLNLGDSVGDISKQTGFSDSTIRRRVKLLELDKDKFAQSIERGATFADYEALSKIKDIKVRNKVLDKIGTENFAWELKTALQGEARAENRAIIITALKKFATKIKDSEAPKHQYVRYISLDSSGIDTPDDAEKEKYFFTESSHSITLYKERQVQEKPKKTPEEIERDGRLKQLRALFKQAYELRLAFARGFRATSKAANVVDKKVIEILFSSGRRIDNDVFRALFAIEKKFRMSWEGSEKGETYDEAVSRILADHSDTSNTTLLFWGAYCTLEDEDMNCLYWGNSLRYNLNKALEELYGYLTSLGYAMSDEEKALLDGTHELYDASEIDVGDDDEEDEDYDDEESEEDEDTDADPEDPCVLCKSAHPSCDKCCAVCDDRCNSGQVCRKQGE